jgi:hypothetical protein
MPVDVAAGSSATGVDHSFATTVPAGTTSLALSSPGPGRHFVSVAPHGERTTGFEPATLTLPE